MDRIYAWPMMSGILRRLVVALSVLAFVSGMTVQAIPSAEALGLSTSGGIAKADPDCPRMAKEYHGDSVPVPAPRKGITLDCVKHMGCLGTPALPDRSDAVSAPIAHSIVAYWAPYPALAGRDVEPDRFPPIAG
jgi:hypothetical protein